METRIPIQFLAIIWPKKFMDFYIYILKAIYKKIVSVSNYFGKKVVSVWERTVSVVTAILNFGGCCVDKLLQIFTAVFQSVKRGIIAVWKIICKVAEYLWVQCDNFGKICLRNNNFKDQHFAIQFPLMFFIHCGKVLLNFWVF